MPTFGVLTHDPNSTSPYTKFSRTTKSTVKDLFSTSLETAKAWDEERKAGILLLDESAEIVGIPERYRPDGTEKPAGEALFAEFADYLFPEKYTLRGEWSKWPNTWSVRGNAYSTVDISENRSKAISQEQLADIMGVQPEKGRNNPVLNCIMAYQWSLTSILESRQADPSIDIEDAIGHLNKEFFVAVKQQYLDSLKFEDRESYKSFSKLFAPGEECEYLDLSDLSETCEKLIGYEKDPVRNQKRIEENAQRHVDIWKQEVHGTVLGQIEDGKVVVSEPGAVLDASTCNVGQLNKNIDGFSTAIKGGIKRGYIGAGDRHVADRGELDKYDQFTKAFYKSKGLPTADGILEALYKIQQVTLDSRREPEIDATLKQKLSDGLIKGSKDLLDVHFSAQSAVQQLVSAEYQSRPKSEEEASKLRKKTGNVAVAVDRGIGFTSGLSAIGRGFVSLRRGIKRWGWTDSKETHDLSGAIQDPDRASMVRFLDGAIRDGFQLKEIPKADGSGSLYRMLNKVQSNFIDQYNKKKDTRNLVLNAGCGAGKSYILNVLEEAGHNLVTISWPVDERQKAGLMKKLGRFSTGAEVIIVLDDTSKVADSFADKVENHTASIIREAYACGLKPTFIHSSATAQLPKTVKATPVVESKSADIDQNVKALQDGKVWSGDRIRKENIAGTTAAEKFHDCLEKSAPKSNDHSVLYLPSLNEALIKSAMDKLGQQDPALAGRVFVYFDEKQKEDKALEKFYSEQKKLEGLLFKGTIAAELSQKDVIRDTLGHLLGPVNGYQHVSEGEDFHDNAEVRDRQKLVNELWELSKDTAKKDKFYARLYEEIPGKGFAVQVGGDGVIQRYQDYENIKQVCTRSATPITYLIGSENYVGRNFLGNDRMKEFHVGVFGHEMPCSMSAVAQLLGRNRQQNFLDKESETKLSPMTLNFIAPDSLSKGDVQGKLETLDLAAPYRSYIKQQVKPFLYDLCDMDVADKKYSDKKPRPEKEDKETKEPVNKYDRYLDFKNGLIALCKEKSVLETLQKYQKLDDSKKSESEKEKIEREFLDRVQQKLGKAINFEKEGGGYVLHKGEGKDKERPIKDKNAIAEFARNMTNFGCMYANWHGAEILKDDAFKKKKVALDTKRDIVETRRELESDLELDKDSTQYQSTQNFRTSLDATAKNPDKVSEKEHFRVLQSLSKLEDMIEARAGMKEIKGHLSSWRDALKGEELAGVKEVKKIITESKSDAQKGENAFAKSALETFARQLEDLEKVFETKEKTAMEKMRDALKEKGIQATVDIKAKSITVESSKDPEGLKRNLRGIADTEGLTNKPPKFTFKLEGRVLLSNTPEELAKKIADGLNASIVASTTPTQKSSPTPRVNVPKMSASPVNATAVPNPDAPPKSWVEREGPQKDKRVSWADQFPVDDRKIVTTALQEGNFYERFLPSVDALGGKLAGGEGEEHSILIYAISEGHSKSFIAELLKSPFVSVNDEYKGMKALHYAINCDNVGAVEAMLEHNPELINAPDNNKALPKDLAKGKSKEMNDLLDKHQSKTTETPQDEVPNTNEKIVTKRKFSAYNAAFAAFAVLGVVMAGLFISGIFGLASGIEIALTAGSLSIAAVGAVGAVPLAQKEGGYKKEETPPVQKLAGPTLQVHAATIREQDRKQEESHTAGVGLH